VKTPGDFDERAAERLSRVGALPFVTFGNRGHFFTGWVKEWREIWEQRELLGRLVNREVKARYKDSSLGILWSLFRPLVQLLIYYFAIGQILGAARSVPNFAIFVFVGLTTWALYSEIITGSTSAIIANSGLVKKVYLPREIFPFSAVGSALINFFFQLVVLVGGIVFLTRFPDGLNRLLVPLALVTLIVFTTAVGLVLSAVNVYIRDTQQFVEIYLAVFFWLSPIVYPFSYVHTALNGNWLEQVYLANPVTVVVIAMQRGLWSIGSAAPTEASTVWPDHLDLRLLITLAVSLVFLWVAQRIFSRLQSNFAQEI
jgi:ABC-2 type transport system permease protein